MQTVRILTSRLELTSASTQYHTTHYFAAVVLLDGIEAQYLFGSENTSGVVDSVKCSGTEQSLLDCNIEINSVRTLCGVGVHCLSCK